LSLPFRNCFLNTHQETSPQIRAAVFISGKKDDFIAGADVKMFVAAKACASGSIVLPDALQTVEELQHLSSSSQKLFDRVESYVAVPSLWLRSSQLQRQAQGGCHSRQLPRWWP
jgi:hypothetical protein